MEIKFLCGCSDSYIDSNEGYSLNKKEYMACNKIIDLIKQIENKKKTLVYSFKYFIY